MTHAFCVSPDELLAGLHTIVGAHGLLISPSDTASRVRSTQD